MTEPLAPEGAPDEPTEAERAAMDAHVQAHADGKVRMALNIEESRLAYLARAQRRVEIRENAKVVLLAAVIALAVWTSITSIGLQNEAQERGRVNRELLVSMNSALDRIEMLDQFTDSLGTADERAAQLQALVDGLATRVDCNTRSAIGDAIGDAFGQQAQEDYRAKIDALCEADNGSAPPPSGTTTTTPG